METGSQPDVSPGTRDAVLEYESPAAAASTKGRGRQRFFEWLVVVAICAALVALLMPTLPRGKRTPALETISKAQASQFMAALTRHFAERGTYPTKLDDLVPGYLPALPPPTKNTKWGYRPLNNGSAYELVWTQSRYVWKYDSISDKVNERAVRGQ